MCRGFASGPCVRKGGSEASGSAALGRVLYRALKREAIKSLGEEAEDEENEGGEEGEGVDEEDDEDDEEEEEEEDEREESAVSPLAHAVSIALPLASAAAPAPASSVDDNEDDEFTVGGGRVSPTASTAD